MNEKLKTFIIAAVFGAALVCLSLLLTKSQELGLAHRLCDGFFVAAVALLGSAGLSFVRNHGLFDIFGFGIKSVLNIHWPWMNPNFDEKESYAEYKQRKQKERKSPAADALAGCIYLLLAFIMLAVFYTA